MYPLLLNTGKQTHRKWRTNAAISGTVQIVLSNFLRLEFSSSLSKVSHGSIPESIELYNAIRAGWRSERWILATEAAPEIGRYCIEMSNTSRRTRDGDAGGGRVCTGVLLPGIGVFGVLGVAGKGDRGTVGKRGMS